MRGKRLISVISVVVALGVVGLLKFVVLPKLELAQKKKYQWEDARPEIKARFHEVLAKVLSGYPEKNIIAVEDCMVDEVIPFLNQSGCDFYYVKATTSKQEAMKNQMSCLKKAGYDKKETAAALKCVKMHLPKTWDFLEPAFEKGLEKSLKSRVADVTKRKELVSCTAKKMVANLNASSCKPVKQDATTLAEVLVRVDSCASRVPKLNEQHKKGLADCYLKVMGKPLGGAASGKGSSGKVPTRRHRRRRGHRRRR